MEKKWNAINKKLGNTTKRMSYGTVERIIPKRSYSSGSRKPIDQPWETMGSDFKPTLSTFGGKYGFSHCYDSSNDMKATEKEDLRQNVGGADYNKIASTEADDFMDGGNRPLKTPAGVRWTPAYGDRKTLL